jgi:hypothetical protein
MTQRFAIVVFLLATRLFAYGDQDQDRNHPEVRWFTSETQHFRFHYEKGLRDAAEACAARAEAVYPEITALYGWEPGGKTDFLVYDEDYSNGWAIASLNTMAIWDADLGFELRGSKEWIRDVVAHEFAHVISIQEGAKSYPWISDLELGWDDGSDRAERSSGWLLWSMDPYSMSMAEGTAQWTSEKMGGDRWDTHRSMIQRTAARADSLLPWARMGAFTGTGMDYERVYGQGYSLMRHIERTRGREMAAKWWRSLSVWHVQTPGAAWKRLTGQSGDSLWSEWRDSARALADRQVAAASPLVEGRKLFGDAFNCHSPRWWNDTLLLFSSNRGSDFQINSLWAYDLKPRDTADRSWVVAPAIRSPFSFDTAARKVWFHSGREDDSRGRPVLDLFSANLHPGKKDSARFTADPKPEQKRLTREMHAFVPSVFRDSLAAVVRDRQAFSVRILPASGEGEGRILFPLPDSVGSRYDEPVYGAEWSPDGASLALDRFDGKLRRVDLVDRTGKPLRRLGDSLSEWRDPAFSRDGKWVYLSSDRTGIFNLYRQNLSTGAVEQVTSEAGGAFQPVPSPDGRRVAYLGWGTDGYSLRLLDTIAPFALRPIAAPQPRDSAPAQTTWDLASQEQSYSPIPDRGLLSPILYAQRTPPLFGYEGSQWKFLAGARGQLLDPARRNTVVLLGLLDVGHGFDYLQLDQPNLMNPRQEKLFLAGWENRSWWPTLFLEGSWQNLRGQDTSSVEADTGSGRVRVVQPWAMQVGSLLGGARYSITRNQKLHAELSWTGYDFDLYASDFRFQAYSALSPSVFWTYLDKEEGGEDKIADQRGTFARVQFATEFADLQRSGTFADVFEQEANGAIRVKTVSTTVHRASLDVRKAFGNPLWDDQTLEFDAQGASVVGWDSPADSLSDFYLEGLSIPGYPDFVPGQTERRLFQGTNTAYLRAATRFPLVHVRSGAWIFWFDDWSAGASVQAGRAWRGDWYDADRSARSQAWDWSRSVSWETRLSGRIHSAYPMHLSLEFSRAVDRPDGIRLNPVRVAGIPTGATRIDFGLNAGLDEWAIIDQPLRRLGLLPAPRRLW